MYGRFVTPLILVATLSLVMTSTPASARVTPEISNWTLNGDAERDGGRLLLTTGSFGVAGSGFITRAQRTDRSFVATFKFVVCCDDASNPNDGGDGFAFVIQNSGPTALGAPGSGLGYAGISQALAFEFDTFNNGTDTHDPSGMHVAFMSEGAGTVTADHAQSQWGVLASADVPVLNDGLVHTAKIVYKKRQERMEASIDGGAKILSPVDLDTHFAQPDNGRAWFGFTASTGGVTQRHLIKTFKLRYV